MCAKEAALRGYEGPTLFAIPGNHDWIDGLDCFQRHIQHKGWLGGWLMPQVFGCLGVWAGSGGPPWGRRPCVGACSLSSLAEHQVRAAPLWCACPALLNATMPPLVAARRRSLAVLYAA